MSYEIVVGIDGSENSERALRWALDEARVRSARLTAVFAWQLPLIGIPNAFDRDELEQKAKDFLLSEIARAGRHDDVEVVPIVAQGEASASLLGTCGRIGADLLVLGSRGHVNSAGQRLGSVGQECAAHAPCPVVIARPGAADAGRAAGAADSSGAPA